MNARGADIIELSKGSHSFRKITLRSHSDAVGYDH
jgi:hypothetical protein